MTRLAGVPAGRGRRADLRAALALVASRARSASRSRSARLAFASWVVMVYMMFSFRSSPPQLAAVHTGDERAAARWTTRGKYPRPASGPGRQQRCPAPGA
jgi:alpha/beta superfamily hydrolase